MARLAFLTLVLISAPLASADDNSASFPEASSALQSFVDLADPAFRWSLVNTTAHGAGSVHELRVTSQKWQGIPWTHAVEIYEPKTLSFPNHALLFVTGGSTPSRPGPKEVEQGLRLAAGCGARVVMLHQTPNQPLLGNRKEDDLITETWLKYLETGDASWPLLFPMVKSAVKTMDAVAEYSQQGSGQGIEQFVITGASKRGWTSWLTPVTDKRVIATAPIVIDVLNFRAQMDRQLATWGSFSVQIGDYTRKGLVKRPGEMETQRETTLREMMDPFSYRKQLTLPKLLIVGTNDPYWVVDAMNVYWDDLEGQKFIRQVPNAGHGLEGGQEAAFATLAVFFRHAVSEQPLPNVSWDIDESEQRLKLSMSASPKPESVKFWTARSDDNDFRDETWKSTELRETNSQWQGTVERTASKHVAVLGEFVFEFEGTPWSLTTLVYRR